MIEYKQCTLCGQSKEINKDNFRLVSDKRRSKAYFRARCICCDRKQTAKIVSESRKAKGRDRLKEYQSRAEKKGKQYIQPDERNKNKLEAKYDKLAEQNARQAWKYWIEHKASDKWLEGYWEAAGQPWRNRRLSDKDRYSIKYQQCEEFRANEKQRQVVYKYQNPDVAARYGERRKALASAASDGTLTKSVLRGMIKEAQSCAYCGIALTSENKTLDHMDALSNGGAHSKHNLIVCCATCNSKKRAKPFDEWISCLPEWRRCMVRASYLAKRTGIDHKLLINNKIGSSDQFSNRG